MCLFVTNKSDLIHITYSHHIETIIWSHEYVLPQHIVIIPEIILEIFSIVYQKIYNLTKYIYIYIIFKVQNLVIYYTI